MFFIKDQYLIVDNAASMPERKARSSYPLLDRINLLLNKTQKLRSAPVLLHRNDQKSVTISLTYSLQSGFSRLTRPRLRGVFLELRTDEQGF